jgi:hypothetical protein
VIVTFEYKLSLLLQIPYMRTYSVATALDAPHHYNLLTAIRHQNIIGWDLFLKGYTSKYWMTLYQVITSKSNHSRHPTPQRDTKLVSLTIQLFKSIWEDRNQSLHGTSRQEASVKARKRILNKVHAIYRNPTKLASRYSQIKQIPLHDRLRHSTKVLQRRLTSMDHQWQVTTMINNKKTKGQLLFSNPFVEITFSLRNPSRNSHHSNLILSWAL